MSKTSKLHVFLKSVVKESIREYFEENNIIGEIKSLREVQTPQHNIMPPSQPKKSIYDGRNLNLNAIKNMVKEDKPIDDLSMIKESEVDDLINNMLGR